MRSASARAVSDRRKINLCFAESCKFAQLGQPGASRLHSPSL